MQLPNPIFSSYVEYTFVYNKSYNLNDSVALGHGVEEDFISMADLGFSGITVEFKQQLIRQKVSLKLKTVLLQLNLVSKLQLSMNYAM